MDKPMPAFYACYLLRSTVRHSSLYVGSTPNPVRRLRQHNGEAKGGAVRTSRDSLRPWEMACLVTGFPSKIAALQFEWAWQNPHLTRHLDPSSRLTSTKSPRPNRRRAKPRLTLIHRLANLHSLLRSSSFSRWPLTLTFFAGDVHTTWQRWTKQHTSLASSDGLREGLLVRLDESIPATTGAERDGNESEAAQPKAQGIHALDVSYIPLKPHLSKSLSLLSPTPAKNIPCSICHRDLPASGAATLICPKSSCTSATHLTCLSAHFLSSDSKSELIPTHGTCPCCHTALQWVDLVKELSLRMRGEKEMAALFKEPRKRRAKGAVMAVESAAEEESEGEGEEERVGVLDEEAGEWHYLPATSDVDVDEEAMVHPKKSRKGKEKRKADESAGSGACVEGFASVVEDSDWDDAEIIL